MFCWALFSFLLTQHKVAKAKTFTTALLQSQTLYYNAEDA